MISLRVLAIYGYCSIIINISVNIITIIIIIISIISMIISIIIIIIIIRRAGASEAYVRWRCKRSLATRTGCNRMFQIRCTARSPWTGRRPRDVSRDTFPPRSNGFAAWDAWMRG